MGIIENIQNATITPPNTTGLINNLNDSNSVVYIQEVLNDTTNGWAVFIFLMIIYFFSIYISNNSNQLAKPDPFKTWILTSLIHVILSIILFTTNWLPDWQKFLWGILIYMIGLVLAYIVKPKLS